MSKGIDYLRQRYQQLRNYAYNSQMKKVNYKDVVKYKDEARKQMDKMERSNSFENLQQVDFYRDKFTQLDAAMVTASKNKIGYKDFTLQARQILKQKGFTSRNSYLSQAPIDPKTTSQQPAQSKVLQSFFDEKRSKIVPQVGFRSLLQNPPISPKNFKKRIGVNNDQIARLRNQNQQLKRKLQSGVVSVGMDNNLQVQIRRQQERIRFLQNENQKLSRDNTKLKSQRSVTVYTTQANYDDYLYSPYIFNPRQNDLIKIGMRNSDIDSYSNYQMNNNQMGFQNGEQVHYQNNDVISGNLASMNNKLQGGYDNRNYDTFSQVIDNDRNKDRFSIFEMSRSHYSDYGNENNFYNSNGSSGIQDSRTAARNKVSFFKPSGMLVRQQDYEIAYKRSDSNNRISNRIILYFNNKTNQIRKINVSYEWQQNYYDIQVSEKINQLDGLKQARQVVQVRLKNNNDINSVIEANIDVDGRKFKLWLPAMFIKISRPREGMMQSNDKMTKTIFPSKIFSSQIQAQKIIENLQIYGRGEAWLWGESAVHDGPIKLQWKQSNKLQVTASKKWIDFITFVLFDYR